MDDLVKGIVTALLGYGLPGIVIIGLCGLVYLQRKDILSQKDELKNIYEARRIDSLAWQTVVRDNTEAMVKMRESITPEISVIKQFQAAQSQSMRDFVTEIRDLRPVRRTRDEVPNA